MDKKDPRWNDERITPSSGNVFLDLGFNAAEARVMAIRAELMIQIERRFTESGSDSN